MDLIYKQTAIDTVRKLYILEPRVNNDYVYDMAIDQADNALRELPSVEAEPVRHGRWETDGMLMDDGEYLMTRCTVCGTAYEYGHNENYCGYCGARMDGE